MSAKPPHNTANDTQWPRWEVFKQDAPTKPHQAVGSVHAGDPEHALLSARNVFARRPNAVSLWVAPAAAIFSVTAEELSTLHLPEASGETSYLIFCKTGHRRSMTFVEHLGAVKAEGPEAALSQALKTFDQPDATVWWVLSEAAVVRSSESDVDSWFAPARTKTYKQQSAYGLVGQHPSERRRERD